MTTGTRTVTLLSRPGCHLCDAARADLERVRAMHSFELEEVDIESDDALHRAHLERIPVVLLDGEELFHLWIEESVLLERLGNLR